MWRYLAGGVAGVLMIAAGWLLFNGRATSDPLLPPQPAMTAGADDPETPLPDRVPEASPKTREEKRFNRYDKDRDGAIGREEYLVSRRKAYTKLDTNGDGRLSFDEWAAKTTTKFATADRDKSGSMDAAEFATTAVKRSPKPRCVCAPQARNGAKGEDEGE